MTTRVVCLPDGLELAFSEVEDGIRLQSYGTPVHTGSAFGDRIQHREPSEVLRDACFATVEELVAALRRELGRPG